LSYKVAEPNSETYTAVSFTSFTGPSAPATVPGNSVPSAQIPGTYTLTFTGNDAGTLTTPDGTSGTFVLPTNTAETYFTEGVAEPAQADTYNFLMYLGGQANDASFIDKAVVYQSITVTGPPNGGQASDNFVNDANNSLTLQNWESSWTGNSTTTPSAVVLVPTNAPYWISWSLPAAGFVLADSTSLGANAKWINVSTYAPVAMYGSNAQLISVNDLSSTNAEFFSLIERNFSQLLVLLPGQTFTPGTAPGYSGTPTQVNGGSSGFAEENVTVLAVDKSFNLVTSVTDTITLSSTDGGATLPNPETMANGSVTFSTANSAFYFGDDGTFTITAQDTTTPSIPSATSASVVVAN
jgi:hypothetical protein